MWKEGGSVIGNCRENHELVRRGASGLRGVRFLHVSSGEARAEQAPPAESGCCRGQYKIQNGAANSNLDVTVVGRILSNRKRRKEKSMLEVILKRFEQPDEIRTFEKGRFELVRLGGMTIGRGTYEPGWKWAEHVGRAVGAKRCGGEHGGVGLCGQATGAVDDGVVIEMKAGDVF